MADCANCGAANSPECENCTKCGKPVGGIRSAPPNSPTGGRTVFGTGSIGAKGKWFSGIQALGEKAAKEIAEQVSTIGPTRANNKVRKPGTGRPKPTVYTIPQINIPVANTEEYEVSSNTELYIPAIGTEIGNGAVDYVKFAEKMQAQATELANNLQTLKNQKGVSSGAGGGVPDGPDCDIDVEYPANTFTIEVKSKFEVIPCEDPVPCEFTCSTFTVNADDTVTITNGTITITLSGGTLSFAGVTAMDLPSVTTIGGNAIADKSWVTSGFSENTHTHTFSGTGSDGNTSITISGTTSAAST